MPKEGRIPASRTHQLLMAEQNSQDVEKEAKQKHELIIINWEKQPKLPVTTYVEILILLTFPAFISHLLQRKLNEFCDQSSYSNSMICRNPNKYFNTIAGSLFSFACGQCGNWNQYCTGNDFRTEWQENKISPKSNVVFISATAQMYSASAQRVIISYEKNTQITWNLKYTLHSKMSGSRNISFGALARNASSYEEIRCISFKENSAFNKFVALHFLHDGHKV